MIRAAQNAENQVSGARMLRTACGILRRLCIDRAGYGAAACNRRGWRAAPDDDEPCVYAIAL